MACQNSHQPRPIRIMEPPLTAALHTLSYSVEHEDLLKRYWQHAGEVVSSRVARLVLAQLQDLEPQKHSVPLASSDTVASLRNSLAEISGANADDICTFTHSTLHSHSVTTHNYVLADEDCSIRCWNCQICFSQA